MRTPETRLRLSPLWALSDQQSTLHAYMHRLLHMSDSQFRAEAPRRHARLFRNGRNQAIRIPGTSSLPRTRCSSIKMAIAW